MLQTIILAKHYKRTPSEILRIDDPYIAYMIDETAYYYELQAGTIDPDLVEIEKALKKSMDWDYKRAKAKASNKGNNMEFIEFIEQTKGGNI